VKFPTGGNKLLALSPRAAFWQDLVRFQSRQYSLDGRRWRFCVVQICSFWTFIKHAFVNSPSSCRAWGILFAMAAFAELFFFSDGHKRREKV